MQEPRSIDIRSSPADLAARRSPLVPPQNNAGSREAASPKRADWTLAVALGIAALSLGEALQQKNGFYTPLALALLSVSLLVLVAALAPGLTLRWRLGRRTALGLLGACLARQVWLLASSPPGSFLPGAGSGFAGGVATLGLVAVVCGIALAGRARIAHWGLLALLVVFAVAGASVIRARPRPPIDVFAWHPPAFAAMSEGRNPYALKLPNLYRHARYYGPGMVERGLVDTGYPYPPLSLLVGMAADTLTGDYRYALLLAMVGAAALMAGAVPGAGPLGVLAAALFLSSPRSFFVLEQGWTEPYLVFLLALVVYCAQRARRWLPWALGAFFAIKQYLVFTLLPLLLVLPGSRRERLVLAGSGLALAALVSLPWVLWDVGDFFRSIVRFQATQPFRIDALSYLAWLVQRGGPQLPSAVAFAMVLPAALWGAWRAPRSASRFAAAVALVVFAFFAFNKQAFCNYYYVVIGSLCCSLATLEVREARIP